MVLINDKHYRIPLEAYSLQVCNILCLLNLVRNHPCQLAMSNWPVTAQFLRGSKLSLVVYLDVVVDNIDDESGSFCNNNL